MLVGLDEAREKAEAFARELADARVVSARAEAGRDAAQALVADLRAERDRLAAELTEVRKPALVRLIEAFRRR